jgi:hypothetical protein
VEVDVAWRTRQSDAPPDTVRCASHVTRPLGFNRWSFCLLGHRTVTVHCSVRLLAPVLTSARAGEHCSAFIVPSRRPLVLCSRYSTGTPDSPVNYSGVAPRIPEGGKFGVGFPGAPDTVRWHTGRSGAPDQGTLRLSFALFVRTLSWSFSWFVVKLWHL